MSKYAYDLELANNTSTGMILQQVQPNSLVLEFGCAAGRMTKYLSQELHCKVYIVEYCKEDFDKAIEYAEDGLCDDILSFVWVKKFADIKFDYILFADVLEHLTDPEKVLNKTTDLLKEDGAVLCSIPNAAHGDAVLQLYENHLNYRTVGLFDNTHIHLFAYHDIVTMVERAGYKIIDEDATYWPVYTTEIASILDKSFQDEYNQILARRMLSDVYQFIIKLQKKEHIDRFYLHKKSSLNFSPENSSCEILTEKQQYIISPQKATNDRYTYHIDFNEEALSTLKLIPKVKGACIIRSLEVYSKYTLAKVTPVNGKKIGDFIFFVHDEPCIKVEFETPVSEIMFSYSMTAAYGKNEQNFLLHLEKHLSEVVASTTSTIEKMKNHFQAEITTLQNNLQKERDLRQSEQAAAQAALEQAGSEYENNLSLIQSSNTIEQKKNDEIINTLRTDISREKETTANVIFSINAFMKEHMAMQRTHKDNLFLINQSREISSMLHQANLSIQILQEKLAFFENQNAYLRNAAQACGKLAPYVRLAASPSIVTSEHEWSMFGKLDIDRTFSFPPSAPIDLQNSNTSFDLIPANECFKGTIAVQLHLYYVDLIPEFFHYLNQIPYPFDLYISCREEQDLAYVGEWFRNLRYVNDIIIRHTKNRGRDIAPVYVLFREEIEKHDYLLHIHSKKSFYTGNEQTQWRTGALNSLLGHPIKVKQIFSIFESKQNIGLIYPANETLGILAQHWLSNKTIGDALLASLGIQSKDGIIDYPVGSFFWAKTQAIKKLFNRNFAYEDFPPEAGQTDGTLAHALERVIAFVCENAGYRQAIINSSDNSISLDRSYTPYIPYFRQTREDALHYLKNFECITFDIFDTLITRRIYQPDDVFDLISLRILQEMNIHCNYKKMRKQAEALVWQERGASTSIHEIYRKFAEIIDITTEQAEQIKQFEIEAELSLCVPRKDMLWVFNELKAVGRDIILISDMYLPSEIIAQMLKKCGYDGWSDLLVSCDCGYRKDNGTMWEFFFQTHDKEKVIHVGDNFVSDIQMLVDRKCNAFILLNSTTAFSMTDIYAPIMQGYDGSVPASLILGSFVNEFLCNSPFCFEGENNKLLPLSHEDAAAAIFGPLLFTFVAWIAKEAKENEKLLFLAREGWLLQKLYQVYCKARGITELDNCYFLASRRAASFAAIRNLDDIKEVLSQHYNGPLGKLLDSRLAYQGIISNAIGELKVICPDQAELIGDLLKPELAPLLQSAAKERKAYLQYFTEQICSMENSVVVDVGYAGTIQYYLSKAFNTPIGGYYLALLNTTKTRQIGCKSNAIYTESKSSSDARDIYNMSLPLEGILQAPYGQFKHFHLDNGQLEPVFDSKLYYPFTLKKMQQAVYRYIQEMGTIFSFLPDNILPGTKVSKTIYLTSYNPAFIDAIKELTVQDDYCSGGTLVFSNGSWNVDNE